MKNKLDNFSKDFAKAWNKNGNNKKYITITLILLVMSLLKIVGFMPWFVELIIVFSILGYSLYKYGIDHKDDEKTLD